MTRLAESGGAAEAYRRVAETRADLPVPLWVHPEWAAEFSWLVQGTTGRGEGEQPFDLGAFGTSPAADVWRRWRRLREALGTPAAVHARQVHGTDVVHQSHPPAPGLTLVDGADAHATSVPDVLITVATADCVPVSIVDPEGRSIAVAHAGWRGAAAGVLEAAVRHLAERFGCSTDGLHVHFGPAICGRCYEVGPEVHQALRPGEPPPGTPTPIDLRAVLATRAASLGVAPARITVSSHCTRCGPPEFFSHRGGCRERQVGVLALRS